MLTNTCHEIQISMLMAGDAPLGLGIAYFVLILTIRVRQTLLAVISLGIRGHTLISIVGLSRLAEFVFRGNGKVWQRAIGGTHAIITSSSKLAFLVDTRLSSLGILHTDTECGMTEQTFQFLALLGIFSGDYFTAVSLSSCTLVLVRFWNTYAFIVIVLKNTVCLSRLAALGTKGHTLAAELICILAVFNTGCDRGSLFLGSLVLTFGNLSIRVTISWDSEDGVLVVAAALSCAEGICCHTYGCDSQKDHDSHR